MSSIEEYSPTTKLNNDFSHLFSYFQALKESDQKLFQRIEEYLRKIFPELKNLILQKYGPYVSIGYSQQNFNDETLLDITTLSDGTARSLSLIAALLQPKKPRLMCFEEIETSIHPGAVNVLMDAIHVATDESQVIITTHSPEVLDHHTVKPENIYFVKLINGRTRILPLSQASITLIKEELMGAGELLRANALQPEEDSPSDESFELFHKEEK